MRIAFRHVPFSAEQRSCLDQIAAGAGYETRWFENGEAPTVDALRDCEILMGYFPPDLLRSLPALRWVQTPAAGVERLCGDIYARDDVVLTNGSGAFGIAIAEYMLTGLLMLMRNMPAYMANQRRHVWKGAGECRSICGSRITVVGMGDIGRKFAARAKALGASVRGVRRNPDGVPADFDEVFGASQLGEAVRGVDAVVLALPGTRETKALICKEIFDAMSPGTILVNCGRGSTLDQDALIAALREGRLAGAVLDVFAVEPLPEDSPLWDMDNVIVTPHISGHDDDPINAKAIFEIFRDNLLRYTSGRELTHVVDRARGY